MSWFVILSPVDTSRNNIKNKIGRHERKIKEWVANDLKINMKMKQVPQLLSKKNDNVIAQTKRRPWWFIEHRLTKSYTKV